MHLPSRHTVAALLAGIPSWIPVKALALCALLLIVATGMAALAWQGKSRAERRVEDARHILDAQKLLEPLVLELRKKQAVLRAAVAGEESLSTPVNLADVVRHLQGLAARAGLQEAHFVPQVEGVVRQNAIRLSGRLAAEPEEFRRFLLLLSDQKWITALESCKMVSGSPRAQYTLSIMASYAPPRKESRP
ncbi:MAG: hypothetical protein PUB01_05130 [Desulfovibrionaceae bacterium]|nr:hypothetical protein [Desulfovibrionaceae bacterium]